MPRVASGRIDWYGFTLSFKGVLLEGLEVAFIVLTFGSTQGSIPLAALGAGAAVVLVAGVGVAVRAPLARVPENTMKFAVGIMLTTFGIFWSAEGAGAHWPGLGRGATRRARLRRRRVGAPRRSPAQAEAHDSDRDAGGSVNRIAAFGRFWWDFVVGDDWVAAAGTVIAIGATAALGASHVAAWWLLPVAVALVLSISLRRALTR